MAAFGAGALIAALTIELVAPTAAALGEDPHARTAFLGMVAGAVVGGLMFVVLDEAVSRGGGYLRKSATAISYLRQRQEERFERMLTELCSVPLLRLLPVENVHFLVQDVRERTFADGETIFREGEEADELYLLREGEVQTEKDGREHEVVGPGVALGELSLVTEIPRLLTATARGEVRAIVVARKDFQRWRQECPGFDAAVRGLAADEIEKLQQHLDQEHDAEREWAHGMVDALREDSFVPSKRELQLAREEHEGNPMAIWLGILLDGIPESFVIGSSFFALVAAQLAGGGAPAFTDVIPYTLIAGLFLSNFPEALSSSASMREQGWSTRRVLLMWTSLLVLTALGAGLGFFVGDALPHTWLVAVEGLAAGAMLTMIASTMIPEAVHFSGGKRVGLSTLAGFLSAVCFKLFE